MKAKFIGQSSCGFKTDEIYEITTKCSDIYIRNKKTPCLCVMDSKSKKWCPYSNLESFLRNWNLI